LSFALVQTPGIAAPALATVVGLGGAALGLWLTGLRQRARVVVPFSAGVLLGVALFGLLPELAVELGWTISLVLFAAGYGLLLVINRFAYPVCPTCAHDHDHNACATELHGFAGPLIAAAAVHSFMDGWSVATVQLTVPLGLRVAVPLAVALHKLPEGIALGGILRARREGGPGRPRQAPRLDHCQRRADPPPGRASRVVSGQSAIHGSARGDPQLDPCPFQVPQEDAPKPRASGQDP